MRHYRALPSGKSEMREGPKQKKPENLNAFKIPLFLHLPVSMKPDLWKLQEM
jgi:hypothetical protein